MLLNFEDWLDSEDGRIAKLNWENSGDYEDYEYQDYLKDKYEEYKACVK